MHEPARIGSVTTVAAYSLGLGVPFVLTEVLREMLGAVEGASL